MIAFGADSSGKTVVLVWNCLCKTFATIAAKAVSNETHPAMPMYKISARLSN